MEAADIKATIISGLKNTWHNHFVMTDERDEDIGPEYLTTSVVCLAFCDYVNANGLNGQLVIRAEEMTRVLTIKSQLRAFFKTKRRALLKLDSELRKGNVDIAIFTKGNKIEQPFAVIENKLFLLFTKTGELYKASRKELEKDLIRNSKFVGRTDVQGGVEYSAFTFDLRDNDSDLKEEGKIFCQEKEAFFESLIKSTLNQTLSLSVDVEVETLESNLFDSKKAAHALDEFGTPTYVAGGTSHIAYGIISLYAPRRTVTNKKALKPDRRERNSIASSAAGR